MSDDDSDDADDDEEVCACSSCERGALVVLVALLFACAHSLRAAPTARKHSPTSPAVDTLPSATQGMLCDGELDLHKRSTPTRHACHASNYLSASHREEEHALLSALRNRTVAFLGDSVTRQQYHALSCQLRRFVLAAGTTPWWSACVRGEVYCNAYSTIALTHGIRLKGQWHTGVTDASGGQRTGTEAVTYTPDVVKARQWVDSYRFRVRA